MSADLTSLSASAMALLVKQKQISCEELISAHQENIAYNNPSLNAVIDLADDAITIARALDASSSSQSVQPLRGVPITIKSNVDLKGYCNSNGIPAFNTTPCQEDSAVAANLKAAGAIVIGRTSTPEFSMRWFTSNPIYGVTKNPWNSNITPGGSSGGAAAAVAKGMCAIAHGNDLGGSLRYPAYCCGVATIRPSMGRVPAYNPCAAVERPPLTQTMSVQGPIARNIADVRLGLQVMSKKSSKDPLWTAAKNSGKKRTQGLRVGIAANPYDADIDNQVLEAIDIARKGFEKSGATVVDTTPPFAIETARIWGELLFAETQSMLLPAIREHGSSNMNTVVDAYTACFDELDLNGVILAMQKRLAYQRAWSEMFNDVDVLLMPTSLQAAFENDLDFKQPADIPNMLKAQQPLFTVNLLGLPAVAMPTHVSNGIPFGVQLIGPMHDDYFVLEAAEALEQNIGLILNQMPS